MGFQRLLYDRAFRGLTTFLVGTLFFAPLSASAQRTGLVARYASVLASANAGLSAATRRELAQRLLLLSAYYQIDPRLLLAIVSAESSWRPGIISPVGAEGYGQLMPATAANLKVQPLEPYENLDGTARYLRRMVVRYASFPPSERVRLAVASYNAGPYAVARYGGVPPYRETREYVATVIASWRRFSRFLDDPSTSSVTKLIVARAPIVVRTTIHARGRRPHRPTVLVEHVIRKSALRKTVTHMMRLTANVEVAHLQYLAHVPPPEPVVRYETSRSFVARLFGLKHRVVEPSASPSPEMAILR